MIAVSGPFSLQGATLVECLHGQVEIYGYLLQADGKQFPFFSPSSSSFPMVSGKSTSPRKSEFPSKLRPFVLPELLSDVEKFWEDNQDLPILVFSQLWTHHTYFISNMPQYKGLFTSSVDSSFHVEELNVSIFTDSPRMMVFSPENEACIQRVCSSVKESRGPLLKIVLKFLFFFFYCYSYSDDLKVMVCGGKNTGKSTMNRRLLNSLLNV
jgi:hypothetical protein